MTRAGMCIRIPVHEDDALEGIQPPDDSASLLQTTHATSCHFSNTSTIRNDAVSCVKDPSDSLTEELLQAVEAARTASELEPPPIDPDSIEAQPESIRVLWDRVYNPFGCRRSFL